MVDEAPWVVDEARWAVDEAPRAVDEAELAAGVKRRRRSLTSDSSAEPIEFLFSVAVWRTCFHEIFVIKKLTSSSSPSNSSGERLSLTAFEPRRFHVQERASVTTSEV